MKRFLGIILIIALVFVSISVSAAHGPSVYVDGELIEAEAIIANGRTLVPLRAICEAMNYSVYWNQSRQIAQIENDTTIISVQINNYKMSKAEKYDPQNVEVVELDVPPILYDRTTMVPVRAITEAFNAEVKWDGGNNRVYIYSYIFYSESLDGLRIVEKNKKFGCVDEQYNEVVPLIYEDIISFDDKGSYFAAKFNGNYGIINRSNEVILPFVYDDYDFGNYGIKFDLDFNSPNPNEIVLSKNGKWGITNLAGEEKAPFIYDSIYYYHLDNQQVYVASLGDKNGMVDLNSRKEIFPFIYDWIFLNDDETAILAIDNKCGVMNLSGDVLIPFIYDDIRIGGSLITVCKNEKWGFLDKDGKITIDFKYDYESTFENEISAIVGNMDSNGNLLMGVIDENDTIVLPIIYCDIYDYYDENAYIVSDFLGNYGAYDYYGNVIVPVQYDNLSDVYTILESIIDNRIESLAADGDRKEVNGKILVIYSWDYSFWLNDHIHKFIGFTYCDDWDQDLYYVEGKGFVYNNGMVYITIDELEADGLFNCDFYFDPTPKMVYFGNASRKAILLIINDDGEFIEFRDGTGRLLYYDNKYGFCYEDGTVYLNIEDYEDYLKNFSRDYLADESFVVG